MPLIERDEIWSAVMMVPHCGNMVEDNDVFEAINELPTIDAVPVVRCKDCKYQKNGYCHTPLGAHCVPPVSILVDDEDFCSGGKREEETD